MDRIEDLLSGKLAHAKSLKLSCGLKEFPEQIFELQDTLELLDLSGNELSALPGDFSRFTKLKILFLSDNIFTIFPSVLSECVNLEMIGFKANKIAELPENSLPPKIRWLILTNNQLSSLPRSIGENINLQKVMFAGNKLTQLPDEMAHCLNIELLRISANQLKTLPDWLLNLPKLAWLAFAGNPFNTISAEQDKIAEINWKDLEIKEKLGEGASGIISKAFFSKTDKFVAVKIFKGEVTSDGLPEDEMRACIQAGKHPNLIEVIGKIKGHPQNKKGLVFSLIPPGYKNLGNSPSFTSCTRDVFPDGLEINDLTILKILYGVAEVANQIHSKGISHGDLYAHNILINKEGNPLFGDFGAGAFYDKFITKQAGLIEKIEVRAFGCLVEDLLVNTNAIEFLEMRNFLETLKNDCFKDEVYERPNFSWIKNNLKQYLN